MSNPTFEELIAVSGEETIEKTFGEIIFNEKYKNMNSENLKKEFETDDKNEIIIKLGKDFVAEKRANKS